MTTSLRVTWATWVDQANPTVAYYGRTGYVTVSNQSSHRKFAYLYFTNPFTSAGANVLSATLTLRTRTITGSGTVNIGVDLATKYPVSISQMNWNTRASAAGWKTELNASAPLANDAAWTFDVTNMMQTVANGYGFQGFIVSTSTQRDILIEGNMSAALDATLVVDSTQAPLAPDSLSPSTGQACGTALPILRWSFWDKAGAAGMQACQVQMSDAQSGFASPLWDSGAVASTVCQMDPTDYGCPAPTVDTLRWWRVRNQDSGGLWSDWSDPVSYRWHSRPTVSIIQPEPSAGGGSSDAVGNVVTDLVGGSPGGAGGVFTDPTPTIAWAFQGDTDQTRWRASVSTLQGSAWVVVASSGERVSSETSWTPDVGLAGAGTVRIIVDVWDAIAREATPGLPIYSSAVGDYAFQPSDTVEIPRGITLTEHRPLPTVDLSWTRSEVPDRWDLYLDDRLIRRVTGLSLSTGGDDYALTGLLAPNGTHRWKLFAIVNDVACPSQTLTVTTSHSPTWLCDPDSGDMVCIVGDADHDMTMPETVQEFAPIGGRSVVRITTAQHGYEGTLSGQLVPVAGMPAGQDPVSWRDRLASWKADPGHSLVLLIEDLVMPVQVTEITWASIPGNAGQMFNVSLKFHQTDTFIFGVTQ